jgi:H+/Cl- antiporter ClcA
MAQFMEYGALAFVILTAVVHILLANAIWQNAALRERDQKPLMYAGPGTWALATLIFGIFGLLTYWLVHHSALRKLYSKEGKPHED